MPTFPTLSTEPIDRDFSEALAYDPSIKSQAEDGTILSRARFTTTKKKWTMSYNNLTEADKLLLDAFQTTVMVGALTFTWTNPRDDIAYTVRFAEPLDYTIHPSMQGIWLVSFTLIEA